MPPTSFCAIIPLHTLYAMKCCIELNGAATASPPQTLCDFTFRRDARLIGVIVIAIHKSTSLGGRCTFAADVSEALAVYVEVTKFEKPVE